MAIPSVYINLEDDVSKIVARLKHNPAKQVVLVCPKRSYLFSDSINLRLLKKQTDLLGKEIFILTMDEKGQLYAKEAGFALKFLPKSGGAPALSDVRVAKKNVPEVASFEPEINYTQDQQEQEQEQEENIKPFEKSPLKPASASIVSPALSISTTKPVQMMDVVMPETITQDNIFPDNDEFVQEQEAENEPTKSRVGLWVKLFAVVCILLILALNFVILPKATVAVYPKSEPVTRDMEISVSGVAKDIDSSKLVIPAKILAENVKVSDKFQSQGKSQVGNKAQGTVKIYNFNKVPINLKSQTTTLTVGTKTYTLVNDVSALKPTTYKNAKTKEVDPDSLSESIEVIATSGGEDFNLPAGTRLEISNQVFGSSPQLLYAVTDTEINGGTTRYLSLISQEDIDSAKKQLQEKALKEIKDKIASDDGILVEKAYNFNITNFTTDKPQDTQTPTFEASLEGQVSGMYFKKQDLDNVIKQRIGQTLSGNKNLTQGENDQTVYTAKSLDLNNQLMVLAVHYQGQAVYGIDLGNLTPQLVGKTQNEVNEILRSKAEIDKVEITLAPAWQKKFPWFASKINLNVVQ